MNHTTTAVLEAKPHNAKNEVRNVTIILTVLTLIELAIGYYMIGITNMPVRHFLKGCIVILMLAKAFYIVAYFMHLKHEAKNLIITVVLPLGIFIWFVIAFLADGNSFKNLKNKYNQTIEQKAKPHE